MQGRQPLTVIAALLSGMTLCYASTASAQEPPLVVYGEPLDTATEIVRFADLDLAQARDQGRLHDRVGGAIERVCGIDLGRDGLQDRGYYSCSNVAWDSASAQIKEAIVTGKTSLGAAIQVVGR